MLVLANYKTIEIINKIVTRTEFDDYKSAREHFEQSVYTCAFYEMNPLIGEYVLCRVKKEA